MKIAHYCLTNPKYLFSGNNLDGIRCPYCNGPVVLKHVTKEVYASLPKYREIKKQNQNHEIVFDEVTAWIVENNPEWIQQARDAIKLALVGDLPTHLEGSE